MKVKIKIPETLSEIKLSQYQKFIKTTKDIEDENFIARQMVGIFCNIPDEVVKSIRAKDYDEIIASISKVLEQKPTHEVKIDVDGVKLGFIPNIEEITVGEQIDLDEYFKDVSTMDKAMAVCYRPIKQERSNGYLIEDYKGDGKGLDVDLNTALATSVFFSTLTSDLLNATQKFIEGQVAHNHKVSQILEENGVGTAQFTDSLNFSINHLKKFL